MSDRNLLLFTGGLVLLDIVFLVCWHLTDPFRIEDDKKYEVSVGKDKLNIGAMITFVFLSWLLRAYQNWAALVLELVVTF